MLTVHKYGGSSVATPAKILKIAKSLKKLQDQNEQLVVVVSAMGKTTNKLLKLADKITPSPDLRELDVLQSSGELVTISLLALALKHLGAKAISLSGPQARIFTTSNHAGAFVEKIDTRKILSLLNAGYIVVVAGFQGMCKNGDVTTLGRGGSDTTAVALSAALGCECRIFTDVKGVYTVDPHVYPDAKKLACVGYDQMTEMSVNGAKVLETRCVELAKIHNVKLYTAKTLEKQSEGTYIMKESNLEDIKISGMAVKPQICLATFELPQNFEHTTEFLAELSAACNNFEMFQTTQSNNCNLISLAVTGDRVLYDIVKNNKFKDVKLNMFNNISKISLIGTGFATHKDFVQRTLKILKLNNISVLNLVVTETVISFTINKEFLKLATEILAKEFEL